MNRQKIDCLLLDLDDTLYSHATGTWELVRDRINQFLIDEMHFPADVAQSLRQRLWRQYGTTLRGLQTEYSVDMDSFLNYVHDVPLGNTLSPDPLLDQILHALPQRKVIFTNANAAHAQRVIDLLGVSSHFFDIIDIYAVSPHCKPEVEAFHTALTLLNESPDHCLLVDDSPANLVTAKSLGIHTVSVGLRPHDGSPHIDSIHELGRLLVE